MEEKLMYGGLTVYRERAAFLRRREQYGPAKAAYDEAFRFGPEDVRMLMGRSQVNADVIQPLQAYNDAEQALKLEPKNMLAKNMQARAQYTTAEFEKSVVSNFRGFRARQQPPYFKEGIAQGLATIEDCIGQNAGDVMLNFLPLIKKNDVVLADEDEPQPVMRVSRIPKQEKVQKLTQMQAKKKVVLSRVMAMKYLGPLAYDKFLLQELQKDPCLISANKAGSEQLKKYVDEALNTLVVRQDMLRSQRPYYTVKLAERAESKYQNKYRQSVLANEKAIAAHTVERYLRAIDKCMRANRLKDLMFKAERLQAFLDSKTLRIMPSKQKFLDCLYRSVGQGYLATYRLSYTLSERSNRRRVAVLMGMPVGRPSSFDSVLTSYPFKEDPKLAIEKTTKTLFMCENLMQKCYLQYQLSRLLCQQKNYAFSKYYAKLCQRDAEELGEKVWWMNGLFARLSGDMQQGNVNEVLSMMEESKWCYRKLNQAERIEAFLEKCKEIVLQPDVTDDRMATMKREKEILGIMDEKARIETGVLFKRMSTMPSRRQFSVLPHKADTNPAKMALTDRRKYLQRDLTVVAGPIRPLRRPPVSKVRGFQIFND